MAKIRFKAKVQTMYNVDDTEAYRYVVIPEFKRSHCDMHEFRMHPKYGGIANSDLFPNVLKKVREGIGLKQWGSKALQYVIKLDAIPDNVCVDTSGYLAQVTIEV